MKGIREMPHTYEKIHQSVFKSYAILEHVKKMLDRGDSIKTIKEVVEFLERDPIDESEKHIKMFANWCMDEGYLMDAEKMSPLDINELYNKWFS